MRMQLLSLIVVLAGLQVGIITSFIGLSARFSFFVHHFSFEPKIAQNLKYILTFQNVYLLSWINLRELVGYYQPQDSSFSSAILYA